VQGDLQQRFAGASQHFQLLDFKRRRGLPSCGQDGMCAGKEVRQLCRLNLCLNPADRVHRTPSIEWPSDNNLQASAAAAQLDAHLGTA
jgi:hypothetical protein